VIPGGSLSGITGKQHQKNIVECLKKWNACPNKHSIGSGGKTPLGKVVIASPTVLNM
jgi:hypothetical protein